MTIGVTPFFNKNKQFLFTRIQTAKIIFPDKEKYGLDYSDNFVDIVEQLLNKTHSKRLGTTNDVLEILAHPWFADIDVKAIEK